MFGTIHHYFSSNPLNIQPVLSGLVICVVASVLVFNSSYWFVWIVVWVEC